MRSFDALARVLVPFLAADIRLVDCYWAAKHLCIVIAGCVSDALEHVPRRLFYVLDAGNILGMARIQPNGGKPFRQ